MCFSASASFGIASILCAASIYTITQSSARYKRIALIPLFFALQQACEGLVWLTHARNDCMHLAAPYGFLFFALIFWPIWFSYALLPLESARKRLIFLYGTLAIGALFSGVSFIILYVYGAYAIIDAHHIQYVLNVPAFMNNLYTTNYSFTHVWYLCTSVVPSLLCSNTTVRVLGVIGGVAYLLTRSFFDVWFVSIWCFFAALTSLGVIIIIQQSSRPK